MKLNKNDIIIQGEWDGQPIWREKTSGEKLAYKLRDTKLFKGEKSDKSINYYKNHEQRKINREAGDTKSEPNVQPQL